MPSETSLDAGSISNPASVTVGVVIPTYNRLPFLKEAISSVLTQTHTALEIIVMDDGSGDGTVDYLAEISDPRVRYVLNKTQSALRLARQVTKGVALLSPTVEWCTVVCDDDLLAPDCIAEFINSVVATSARSVVHGGIIFIDTTGGRTREGLPAPLEESALDFIRARSRFERERYLTGVFFYRKAFEDMGGYPLFTTGMAADDALIFSLAANDRLVFAQRAVTYIRIHDNAESQQLSSLTPHLNAIRDYGEFCCKEAARKGLSLPAVVKAVQDHSLALNTHFWLQSVLSSSKDTQKRHQLPELFKLGVNRCYSFPLRVRISAIVGLLTGLCLERIGLYRSLFNKFSRIRVP